MRLSSLAPAFLPWLATAGETAVTLQLSNTPLTLAKLTPPTLPTPSPSVVFLPGDGGWRGTAVNRALGPRPPRSAPHLRRMGINRRRRNPPAALPLLATRLPFVRQPHSSLANLAALVAPGLFLAPGFAFCAVARASHLSQGACAATT